MKAKLEGECIGVGESEFEGKKYPYFEILQRGEGVGVSQVVKVSGNGFKVGDKVSFDAIVSLTDKGRLRVKRIEPISATAVKKPF